MDLSYDLSYQHIYHSDVIDRSVPYTQWTNRTRDDNERHVREAYEREDREWLKRQAVANPAEFLAAADAVGVQIPFASRIWLTDLAQSLEYKRSVAALEAARGTLNELAQKPCAKADCYGLQPQVVGGPHSHEIRDGKDRGANPWPPRGGIDQRQRCLDCADLLPLHRHVPRCVRCNKVHREAAEQARRQQPFVERPAPVFRCLVCKQRIDASHYHGARLCSTCLEERYVDQPAEDDRGLVRNTGAMPQLALHVNRRGESVFNGRILPHQRYGESSWDRMGDTVEWDRD